MTPRLDPSQLPELLAQLPAWRLDVGATSISRHFEFADFKHAFDFMTQVAGAAERAHHHPDWSNAYDVVDIALSTHAAGGLTMKDIELARVIDALASGAGASA